VTKSLQKKNFGGIARTLTCRYHRQHEGRLQLRGETFMTGKPMQVSSRFRATIEATILELERNAARDERVLPTLLSADHRRRQRLLVEEQLDKAFRLREMLDLMSLRREQGWRERVL